MKKLIYCLSVLLATGCTNEVPNQKQVEERAVKEVRDAELLISPHSLTLDGSDATKVATLFQKKGRPSMSRSGAVLVSPNIIDVKDDFTGETLAYIVNWSDNGGFSIISSTKMTEPLLAYSESGYFDVEEASTDWILDRIKTEIRYALDNPNDSIRLLHALSWAMYEMPVGETYILESRAASSNINQWIADKIARMQAKGYKYCGKISWAASHLTEREYKALCADVSSHCDPQYDYTETSLCFTKDEYDTSIGPFVETQWGQGGVPGLNISASNHIAGCGPVAIAQIMNYYTYPSKYNWARLFEMTSVNGDMSYARELMDDIYLYAQPTFNTGGTSVTDGNARNVFNKMGYTVNNLQSASVSSMMSAIKSGKPFYMSGRNSSTGNEHAWICDGYQKQLKTAIVSFIPRPGLILDIEEDDGIFFDYAFKYVGLNPSYDAYAAYTDYFHMNLGNNGTSDGWYLFNSYGGSIAGYNASINMIVPTKP